MIIGEYPCCDGDLHLSMPENSGVYVDEDCPHCGVHVWHYLSRIQSSSWTEAAFLNEYTINLDAMTVEKKDTTK